MIYLGTMLEIYKLFLTYHPLPSLNLVPLNDACRKSYISQICSSFQPTPPVFSNNFKSHSKAPSQTHLLGNKFPLLKPSCTVIQKFGERKNGFPLVLTSGE